MTITAAPSRVEELKSQILAKIGEGKTIAEQAGDRALTAEEKAKITALAEEAKALKAEIDDATADTDLLAALTGFGDGIDISKAAALLPDAGGAKRHGVSAKTLGQQFTDDPNVKAWYERIAPSGTISEGTKGISSPPVSFPGIKGIPGMRAKDIITGSGDESGGALVQNDWRGLLDDGFLFRRPLRLRDLVTNGTTGSDTIEFVRITSWTSGAATVAEASGTAAGDGTADVTGEKPQSDITFERATTTVKTIAHWVPMTKRALADAPQVRTIVDSFLRFGLEDELDEQMVVGDGTGEDFEGILETDGIQTQAWDTDILATTRKAKTKVRTVGRDTPNAYLLNPEDNERIDLTKDDNGGFYFGGPAGVGVGTLWGLPRIESEAVPAGTGVVGNFARAVLWDREQGNISVSDSHQDFFIRNLVAILAELRAAFTVTHPKSFVTIDLTA